MNEISFTGGRVTKRTCFIVAAGGLMLAGCSAVPAAQTVAASSVPWTQYYNSWPPTSWRYQGGNDASVPPYEDRLNDDPPPARAPMRAKPVAPPPEVQHAPPVFPPSFYKDVTKAFLPPAPETPRPYHYTGDCGWWRLCLFLPR